MTERGVRKDGWVKVEMACVQTLRDGYEYIWIDTCWSETSFLVSGLLLKSFSIDKSIVAQSCLKLLTPCSDGISMLKYAMSTSMTSARPHMKPCLILARHDGLAAVGLCRSWLLLGKSCSTALVGFLLVQNRPGGYYRRRDRHTVSGSGRDGNAVYD